MLTALDLADRYHEPLVEICKWYARRVLPEPIKVGDEFRWREEDILQWEEYLRARLACREEGMNPDDETGPPPPIFSHGIPIVDPREIIAQERERKRQSKSKTLAAGSKPIAVQPKVTMPELADKPNKVEK